MTAARASTRHIEPLLAGTSNDGQITGTLGALPVADSTILACVVSDGVVTAVDSPGFLLLVDVPQPVNMCMLTRQVDPSGDPGSVSTSFSFTLENGKGKEATLDLFEMTGLTGVYDIATYNFTNASVQQILDTLGTTATGTELVWALLGLTP